MNQILVPLLHMEETIPVTISGFEPSTKSYQSIFQKSNDNVNSQKFFLESKVLIDSKS